MDIELTSGKTDSSFELNATACEHGHELTLHVAARCNHLPPG